MTSEERSAWLRERQSVCAATDVRRLIIPYDYDDGPQAALIYDEKTATTIEDRPGTPLMEMGLATEDHNAMLYTRRTGNELVKADPITRHSHPSLQWCGASLDRRHAIDRRIVELKYCGPFFSDDWGEEHTDMVPPGYIIQTHWQMFCTGDKFAEVAALCGTGQQRLYRVGFSYELMEPIFEIAEAFWQFVENRERPPHNWVHPRVSALAEQTLALQAGKVIEIADPIAEMKAREWLELKEIASAAEQRAGAVKSMMIMKYMGDAETANCGEYKLSRTPYSKFVKKLFTASRKKKKEKFFV